MGVVRESVRIASAGVGDIDFVVGVVAVGIEVELGLVLQGECCCHREGSSHSRGTLPRWYPLGGSAKAFLTAGARDDSKGEHCDKDDTYGGHRADVRRRGRGIAGLE